MTVLILHGVGGHAGIHWQQWLSDVLKKEGHTVIMPELPNSDHPNRTVWFQTIEDSLADVNLSDLVIVAHSLGVASALDFLETIEAPIRAFISVGGFGEDYGSELNSDFMKEKEIDFKKVTQNINRSFVIYGDDDPHVPQTNLNRLAISLHVEPIIIPKGGHLNTAAGYTEFPLLLELIKAL
jgi:predicted alpha/beta hydrolase family esterase